MDSSCRNSLPIAITMKMTDKHGTSLASHISADIGYFPEQSERAALTLHSISQLFFLSVFLYTIIPLMASDP